MKVQKCPDYPAYSVLVTIVISIICYALPNVFPYVTLKLKPNGGNVYRKQLFGTNTLATYFKVIGIDEKSEFLNNCHVLFKPFELQID